MTSQYIPHYKQCINNQIPIQFSVAPPPCSIMAFLGNTDPDGWVICDGELRSNSDGRYNNLIENGIGTVLNDNYTPPNYKGAFLRGAGTGPTGSETADYSIYSGNGSINTPQHMKIIEHTHAIADHSHIIPSHSHKTVATPPPPLDQTKPYALTKNSSGTSQNTDSTNGEVNLTSGYIDLFGQNTSTFGPFNTDAASSLRTNNTTTNPNHIGTEICPYNYSVNWIIKL